MEGFSSSSLFRHAPPCHFRFKIESFSSLSTSSNCVSFIFDVDDYKWRLVIYPNGKNKLGDGKGYISLYLELEKSCHAKLLDKEISVSFTLLVYDQIRDRYLSVQGASRFHAMKSESGFDEFLPLKIFNEPCNGFLVNNTCMFGADVFVIESATKGQCLSMKSVKPAPIKYTWEINKFSYLKKEIYKSDKFTTAGHDWILFLWPKGYGTEKGDHVSLYLELVDALLLPAGSEVLVEFKLRVVNQLINENHKELQTTICLNASKKNWGSHAFLKLSELINKSTGYLVNDTCILEAEIIVLGSAKSWV